jgi:predicted dehydrogenase
MTRKRYKAGVIGCGFGQQHIQWLKECGCVDVEWIGYHSNRSRAADIAKKFGIKKVTTDPEKAMADVDFVVIVAPVFLHYSLAQSAMSQKKGVVCDKPLAMNSQEAVSLVETARQNGVPNMVLFQWRFNKHLAALKKLIDQSSLGTIHVIQIDFFHDFILDTDGLTWRHDCATSGSGAFGDMGVHLIDCIQWLMNDRIQLRFVNKKIIYCPHEKSNTEDYGMVSFSLVKQKVEGSFHVCRAAKGYRFIRIVIVGENGTATLEMDPGSNEGQIRTYGFVLTNASVQEPIQNPYHYWISHLEQKTMIPNFKDGAVAQQVMDEMISYGK